MKRVARVLHNLSASGAVTVPTTLTMRRDCLPIFVPHTTIGCRSTPPALASLVLVDTRDIIDASDPHGEAPVVIDETSIAPNPDKQVTPRRERDPGATTNGSPPPTCQQCGKGLKTKKGLRYHMLQVHGLSVIKREKPPTHSQNKSGDHQRRSLLGTIRPPSVSVQACATATAAPGVALLASTVRCTFPLPKVVPCPIPKCNNSFSSKSWYTTVTSVKRHMTLFHRLPNTGTQYWCSICNRKITVKPANHNCLQAAGLVAEGHQPSDWPCEECGESFTTQNGLFNHQKAHERKKIADKMVPLVIPNGPKKRKAAKKNKLAPVSTGEPSDMPLAFPPDNTPNPAPFQLVANTSNDNQDQARGRIDIQKPSLISSFIDPLDTLLEIDEISGSKAHLEALVQGITETVQEHFHLGPSATSTGTVNSRKKGLDVHNHQQVQQCYRWNRRKCVRALTQMESPRCPVSKDKRHTFFKRIWETTRSPAERSPPDPPSRPAVVESLSRSFVEACLSSAENSAPGTDFISYRHWREVDPSYSVITRIFNAYLKMADIPSVWKLSSTILIHKRGDTKNLENWRPISLSSTLYKLFTKWLTRKLGDCSEAHDVLSPAQKRFSPHDGVLAHNLLVTHHIHAARRLKKDKLLRPLRTSLVSSD
ncbi:retrovirus-related Pol polyprotein from type-2 retrotransposable element R2DM [Trichonephila clavipes]|nr:retrovirus-related Pol polyprotein from type-2 retrotransposable element R2DM [Trichonephila clavipes]